jgi:undecaprenyl pyrophosphate phosphatase UppP
MRVSSLPARIVYTAVALPVVGAVGFYSCIHLLPSFTVSHPQLDPDMDGSGIFQIAICVGAALAFAAALFTLTLPWIRHRKRDGRLWRIALSCVVVVLASLLFADEGFELIYDFLFVAWLTYTLAFTFVRYGVIDQARRPSSSGRY